MPIKICQIPIPIYHQRRLLKCGGRHERKQRRVYQKMRLPYFKKSTIRLIYIRDRWVINVRSRLLDTDSDAENCSVAELAFTWCARCQDEGDRFKHQDELAKARPPKTPAADTHVFQSIFWFLPQEDCWRHVGDLDQDFACSWGVSREDVLRTIESHHSWEVGFHSWEHKGQGPSHTRNRVQRKVGMLGCTEAKKRAWRLQRIIIGRWW